MDTVLSALTVSPVAGDSDELVSALMAANLPVDDLTETGRVFFRFSDEDGRTVAFGGYETHGPDALLRSIVVLPEHRGRRIGRTVVDQLRRPAHDAGAERAYLITTTARGFFEHLGFQLTPRNAAPVAILATREAKDLCPSTAPLLSRAI